MNRLLDYKFLGRGVVDLDEKCASWLTVRDLEVAFHVGTRSGIHDVRGRVNLPLSSSRTDIPGHDHIGRVATLVGHSVADAEVPGVCLVRGLQLQLDSARGK